MVDLNKPKLEVKTENIINFSIELNDDYKSENGKMTEEEEIAMATYYVDVLKPRLFKHAAPCECQLGRIVERDEAKNRILNLDGKKGPFNPTILQEDIDTSLFTVIMTKKNGKPHNTEFICKSCKNCGKIEMFGDIIPLTQCIAESINSYINAIEMNDRIIEAEKEASANAAAATTAADEAAEADTTPAVDPIEVDDVDETADGYTMTDVDTGEVTPIGTLNDLIQG